MEKLNKAIFFDRDGIIVKPIRGEAPQKVEELNLISEIIPILKKLRKLGYLLVVVSNQPDTALGKIDEITGKKIEYKFEELIDNVGLKFDGIYYCHHHQDGVVKKWKKSCDCRKPKPGLILKAANKFNIILKNSYMLGDRASDIKAGKLAGMTTILYDPGNSQSQYLKHHSVNPNYLIKNFDEILEII